MQAEDCLRKFAGLRVLVVGDMMLDVYEQAVRGDRAEMFQYVTKVRKRTFFPGGAANVIDICRQLGASVAGAGYVGGDPEGQHLRWLIDADLGPGHVPTVRNECIITLNGRPTTTKARTFQGGEPLGRRDFENADEVAAGKEAGDLYRRLAQLPSESFDVVIFSDYDKGVFKGSSGHAVIQAAKRAGKLGVLDPKRSFAPFAGVRYCTPNEAEAGWPDGIDQILAELPGCQIVETKSSRGAVIYTLANAGGQEPRHYHRELVPTVEAVEVDAVGAGDAFVSGFALAVAVGADARTAAIVGNGLARWWVTHSRACALNLRQIENQIELVGDIVK